MCRHEEELCEEASDLRPFFCGLVILEKSKCHVYLNSLFVFAFGHFLDCLVHEEEFWEQTSDARLLSCG